MKIYNKIKILDIKKIKPYFNNPRENDKTVQALIKAIPKMGFNVPLVIDKKYVIVKGHSRYNAALELGLEKVPCIISEASDKDNDADRLYDNAIQELSKWDYDKLAIELRDIDFKIDDIKFINDINFEYSEIGKKEMDDAYKGFNNENAVNHVKFMCPKCGEEAYLSKDEIDKILK
jgi:ParB-like chromosome segregation protein Spo0J